MAANPPPPLPPNDSSDDEDQNPLCDCEPRRPSKLRKSWSLLNPARRFYNYRNSLRPQGNCGYFAWLDGPINNDYYRSVLTEQRNQLKMFENQSYAGMLQKNVRELEVENARLSAENTRLVGLLETHNGGSWVMRKWVWVCVVVVWLAWYFINV